MTDTIKQLKCLRCGAVWFPKKPNSKPKHCAKCNTPYWNTDKRICTTWQEETKLTTREDLFSEKTMKEIEKIR